LKVIEDYCGPSATLEELVGKGQFLQGEGYKGLFEEARRQKAAASMALNWCFNEPWPCAANNSLISWPLHPKPALRAVQAACRPMLASARIRKFRWKAGELFDPEIWLLSDSPRELAAGTIEVSVQAAGFKRKILSWHFADNAPQSNQIGPCAQYYLPEWDTDRFSLLVRVLAHADLDSEYTLLFIRRPDHAKGTQTMNLGPAI
jgi:beta-mannosidase